MMRALGLLLVAAACDARAVAQPSAPAPTPTDVRPAAVVPSGWVPQPALVEVVNGVVLPVGSTYVAVDAWGDPGAGCFALWTTTQRTRPSTLAAEHADLARALAPLGVAALPPLPAGATTWTATVDAAVVEGGLRGKLRVSLGGAPAAVTLAQVACMHNAREPIYCEAACTSLLDAAAPRPSGSTP